MLSLPSPEKGNTGQCQAVPMQRGPGHTSTLQIQHGFEPLDIDDQRQVLTEPPPTPPVRKISS